MTYSIATFTGHYRGDGCQGEVQWEQKILTYCLGLNIKYPGTTLKNALKEAKKMSNGFCISKRFGIQRAIASSLKFA